MSLDNKIDLQAVLDGLGQGVVIFNAEGKLLVENLAARTILGTDLNVLKTEGWSAASVLFNTRQNNPDETIDAIRSRALKSERPVRFSTFRSGEYIPCWAAAVQGNDGDVYTMITLDVPDWTAMTSVMERFRTEIGDAIHATIGHMELIKQSMSLHKPDESVEMLQRRIGGFTRLVDVHMHRVGRLVEMLERLENIRTGRLREIVKARRRRVAILDFFEDFAERLDEINLVDPETDVTDVRARVKLDVPSKLAVAASSLYLTRVLHDILRNAIMYSMKAAPVRVKAHLKGQVVQFDISDEGYGIRAKEQERVFEPFQRARQPQIIGEFGYGLSLYLCKQEIEAMNGRLWFTSEEGVGTTFSFTLPTWMELDGSSSASSSAAESSAGTAEASGPTAP